MLASIIWMFALAVGVSVLTIATAAEMHGAQMAIAAIVSGFIALKAMREQSETLAASGPGAAFARVTMMHMGLIWIWSTLAIVITYTILIPWQYTLNLVPILLLGAGLCHFVAMLLARVTADGDQRVLVLAQWISRGQLAVTSVAVGALVAAGHAAPDAFGGQAKWAAVNLLATAGMALALIAANAIKTDLQAPSAAAAAA